MASIRLGLGKSLAPIPHPSLHAALHAVQLPPTLDADFLLDAPPILEHLAAFDLSLKCSIGLDAISSRPIKAVLVQPPPILLAAPTAITIEENLECLPSTHVYGMDYRHRIWVDLTKRTREVDRPRQNKTQTSFRKSYLDDALAHHRTDRPLPKAPSFWDLAYALLQPPIVLGKLENLYFPHDLLPFQPAGVQFLMEHESALLADDMGTGKTVQTVVALRLLMQKARAASALIVCPVSVIRQWDEHFGEWAPELLVTVVRGSQKTRQLDWSMPAHVYITAYDTLPRDIRDNTLPPANLDKFDVVVLDEAQYIKNAQSKRATTIRKLKARQRWALTGTPVENRIEDIASIFDFLRPKFLGPYDLYPDRLRQKIAPYFLRRRKQDVIQDLPPKIPQEFWLELDEHQKAAYNAALGEGQAELRALGSGVHKTDIFRVLVKLKQICNFAPDKMGSPKLDLLMEQLENIVEAEQKVIVFSQYISEGVDKIERAIKKRYNISKVIGGQTDRDFQVKQFQESKDRQILLASVRAGGVGLNLQVASYVVHFDHWWNPAVMWQAEDRAHRKGQKQAVNVYSYWISGTIEEKIHQILATKGLLFKDVVDSLSETDLDGVISTDEWLDMLGVQHRRIEPIPVSRPLTISLGDIQQKLQTISPPDFERVVKDLLHALGHPNTKVVGRTGDGGIDVMSSRNTSSGIARVIAQCKRYRGTVGVETARALMGVIAADDSIEKGYLVTTGEFTRECIAFCEKTGVIVALNGIQTANYVRKFGVQI